MKKTIKIFVILFILTSCQSTKDAFSLQKKNSTDEFLVEKKNPLVLPPQYGKLPSPKGDENENSQPDEEIASILGDNDKKTLSIETEKSLETTSIEKSILEKIK